MFPLYTSYVCLNSFLRHIPIYSFFFALVFLTAFGATAAGIACLLFAVIQVDASYWTFAFPSTILVICGTDFVFATGALFVARVAHDDEQCVAAGVYHTSSQVCTRFSFISFFGVYDAFFPSYLSINLIISPVTLFLSNLISNSGRASY